MGILPLTTSLILIGLTMVFQGCGKVKTDGALGAMIGREFQLTVNDPNAKFSNSEILTLQNICNKLAYKRAYLHNSQKKFNTNIKAKTCDPSAAEFSDSIVLILSMINNLRQFTIFSGNTNPYYFTSYEHDQQGLMKKYCESLSQDVQSKIVAVDDNATLINVLELNIGQCEATGSSFNGNLQCVLISEAIKVRPDSYRTIRAHKFYIVNGENATYRGFVTKRDYAEECTDPSTQLTIESTTTSID
jgi:hypothetical protein